MATHKRPAKPAAQAIESISVPQFIVLATDPLAPGLIRFWIGAARAQKYPPAQIRHAENMFEQFTRYREQHGRKR